FPRVLVSARAGHALSEAAQVAVGTEVAEDVGRSVHEQAPHVAVTSLGDSHLWIALARALLPRHEPEIRADVARASEALRVVDGQHEAQCDDRPDTLDLPQEVRDRVAL